MPRKKKVEEKILWCITDPCYLGPREKDFEMKYGVGTSGYPTRWIKEKTGRNAWVGDTLYGDWDNHIHGKGEIVNGHNSFCADSGMWCVCALTEEMLEYLRVDHFPHTVALFKASENIRVEVDKSCPQWVVIRIYDNDELIFETDPY